MKLPLKKEEKGKDMEHNLNFSKADKPHGKGKYTSADVSNIKICRG
jgi:hypothetical protein